MILADLAAVHAALGKSIGNHQCAGLVEAVAPVGLSATWRRGELARGAQLAPGAVIATFDPDTGRYGNHEDGRSHVAIWMGEATAAGLLVIDQWMTKTGPHVTSARTIRFQGTPSPAGVLDCNNGDCFYTVEHEPEAPPALQAAIDVVNQSAPTA